MLHPVTWRPQAWLPQPSARPRNLYGQSRPGQAPASSISRPDRPPIASGSWTPSVAAHVHDFVPPAALQPVQSASKADHTWSNATAGAGASLNSASPHTPAHGTSNLFRLPFFMSQVLKRESDAVNCGQQGSKGKTGVVKSEGSPEVNPIGHLQLSTIGPGPRPGHNSSGLSQAAHFPGPSKQALVFKEQGLAILPPQPLRVHIQSLRQPYAIEAALPYNLSEGIVSRLPKVVMPATPELVRSALTSMKPTIVYAQYECDAGCRSRGICVHFSFLLGCRQAPDGLICPPCQIANVHRPYAAQRICPRHNKRTLTQFTPNLTEDYLPSAAQTQRAFEILERACNGSWEGVPTRINKRAHDDTVGHSQDIHGIGDIECQVYGGGSILPSNEASHQDTEHARKKQRVSADVEAKARKCSSDKENDFEEKSESALHVDLGNCNDQVNNGRHTPRASTTVEDSNEAGAAVDAELFSDSLPPWSPDLQFDLFS
ncbi:hypothetical protein LTR70_005828 [Exophiala xenobiotica]|uniref:Uncharacterized protein n=1 Tax=Lithohypha guttulata TaxID=1690604 RepID=A0ABR0K998_9EURO|nr:hypothetical protein LTR24_005424 [Lithohypha guttulata]KAK5317328.1 hypothetical protein LTR70_005828 [Exophiala xenobiotica]